MNEAGSRGGPAVAVTRRQAFGVVGAAAAAGAAGGAPTAAAASPSGAPVSLLYPFPSATRSVRDLSGLWRFRLDPGDVGEKERWFEGLRDTRRIPVPCSWNDLFDDAQDYFGAAWYETEIWGDPVPAGRQALRFGSAVHHARVWLDGRDLGEHLGGHLPFAFDITGLLRPGEAARLSVRVENALRLDRVPAIPDPATARMSQEGYPQTTYDFFPYAGLDRPVLLVTTPEVHVQDVAVVTACRRGRAW